MSYRPARVTYSEALSSRRRGKIGTGMAVQRVKCASRDSLSGQSSQNNKMQVQGENPVSKTKTAIDISVSL